MYKLMQQTENSLPILVSVLNPFYWDYTQAGYIILASGTRREMEALQAEYMETFCDGMMIELN